MKASKKEKILLFVTAAVLLALGIFAGHGQCLFRNIPGLHGGLRQTVGQSDGDAAAACAHIEQAAGLFGALGGHPVHQFFGLGAGNERGGTYGEAQPAEVGIAQNVLHRLAIAQAPQDILQAAVLLF